MINIDFETRSQTNLLTDGAYNYFTDPSTEVICMAYAQDGGEPAIWHPGEEIPACFMTSSEEYWAWNADFERLCFEYIMGPDHGFYVPPIEQWRCSMYQARCNNLPGALGKDRKSVV